MAKVIFTDGTVKEITPKNGTDFSLEEIKEYINGFLEVVWLRDEHRNIMIIDEEGKIKNLDSNVTATDLAVQAKAIYPYDYIAGNVIVCSMDQFK